MADTFLNHIRLLTSIVVGVVLFFLLPGSWALLARVLVSWNGAVVLFLLWIFLWMRRCSPEQLYLRYKEEDESAVVFLVIVVCAALLSLLAIGVLLSTVRQVTGLERAMHISLAALTI